jgi:multiple antibiotic resistance protein
LDTNSGSIFPVAFPLVAGAGTLTTILSLKAEYQEISIIAGILINLIILFIVIYFSDWLQKNLGGQGTSILRKVFGIILLAISIKLFKGNI